MLKEQEAINTTLEVSERVMREREEVFSATSHVDIDKLKIELEVYGGSEAKSAAMRRAEVLSRLCNEKPIFIDGNPIVGNLTKYKYGGYFIPHSHFCWTKGLKMFALQRGNTSEMTEDDLAWIKKADDYWKGKCVYDRVRKIILKNKDVDIDVLRDCGVGLNFADGPNQVTLPDYSIVLKKGLTGVLAEIETNKKTLDIGSREDFKKLDYYEAASLALNGVITLAQRYAFLAREKAGEEKDPGKKQELERIAETCERVPAHPARNFHEALQAVWFSYQGAWMETPVALHMPPMRFPQYMYPFYKKDKEEGKITDEEVIEMIQFYFLKLNTISFVLSPDMAVWNQSRLGQQLTIGGLKADGEDATNELDFLVLEAQRRIMLPEPLLALVYHDKLSNEFLMKCMELVKTGIGQPAFHDVRKGIESRIYFEKAPLEEARNVAIAGCLQHAVEGYTDGFWEARFNLAKMVELVLNNGNDPLTGIQLGLQTGEPEEFETYEEFYGACKKQLHYFIPLVRDISRVAWNVIREFPTPFGSMFVHDCVENGQDIVDGGSRYSFADGQCYAGGVDAINSLAAIKKCVFEDKSVDMSQLKKALAADFEGNEEIHRMCLDAPKFGNDDLYVDSIGKDMHEFVYQEHQKKPDYLGRNSIQPGAYSVTAHWAFGKAMSALPNGRKARIALTDASVSAQPGTDKKGPTALIKSAARIIDTVKYNSNHLNIKFHPLALKGTEGTNKLLSLIKTYMDLGGYHVQFNCVSAKTLKEAQLNPDEYRNLIVRVAGFSAFFVNLERGVQDEIILRTEQSF